MEKPLNVLSEAIGHNVIVVLRGRHEYRGVLDGYDPHLNVVLRDAEAFTEGRSTGKMATVIVRGDNVIYISP